MMRKLTIGVVMGLLLSCAGPALASPQQDGGRKIVISPKQKAERKNPKPSKAKPADGDNTTKAGKQKKAGEKEQAKPGMRYVHMRTTLGDMVLELNPKIAPITVDNFVQYVKDGYFAGTVFHWVKRSDRQNFIVGGSFLPSLEKKEGLRDPITVEWTPEMKNLPGTIAMVRATFRRKSAQAEFFINVAHNVDGDKLRDGKGYAVFGKVIRGMDTVKRIHGTELYTHPNPIFSPYRDAIPKEPVIIQSARVISGEDIDKAFMEWEDLVKMRKKEATKNAKEEGGEKPRMNEKAGTVKPPKKKSGPAKKPATAKPETEGANK